MFKVTFSGSDWKDNLYKFKYLMPWRHLTGKYCEAKKTILVDGTDNEIRLECMAIINGVCCGAFEETTVDLVEDSID